MIIAVTQGDVLEAGKLDALLVRSRWRDAKVTWDDDKEESRRDAHMGATFGAAFLSLT
jgi:hypothetical protein